MIQVIANNKKAGYDYSLTSFLEAGLVLSGSEVQALRRGGASIAEASIGLSSMEVYLYSAYIPSIQTHHLLSHPSQRARKLLLKTRQIRKLIGVQKKQGLHIVPMMLYFSDKGLAKMKIGLGTKKRKFDKREIVKKRDWDRSKARLIKVSKNFST